MNSPPVRRPGRPGYSLIEVLLAVGIVSMTLSAIAVSLQAMYRAERTLKANAVHGQTVPRLALQLRKDTHAAGTATLLNATDPSAGVLLTLPTSDDTVEYQSAAGRVMRTRRRGEVELGREIYALDKTTTLQWRTIESPSPRVELEIDRLVGKIDSADARQRDRIIAAVALHIVDETTGGSNASRE